MEKITVFGRLPDGQEIHQIVLRAGALECGILTYGGALRFLRVPDRSGNPVDVLLGFDSVEDYAAQDKYIGALIGRYANRIGGSQFSLNGQSYHLLANDGPNHLHGGGRGFDKRVWSVEEADVSSVALALTSPDGDENYPGKLTVRVRYQLKPGGLTIDYWAVSDRDTLCNLTNHAYFNLSGHQSGLITGQKIQLMADRYTPTDPSSIPLGRLEEVAGTPLDLREMTAIGARIDEPFTQLQYAGGYDHNYAVRDWDGTVRLAAAAFSPESGIRMEVYTNQPGIQFYTGNYLDGCPAGKDGAGYGRRCGFCLETQAFPDSPNKPDFPTAVLRAGEPYHAVSEYRFV